MKYLKLINVNKMSMIKSKHILLLFGILFVSLFESHAQAVPMGFDYQTTIRNTSGVVIPNQFVKVRFSFYSGSPTGILQWQEDYTGTTNSVGLIKVVIGNGTTTGAGAVSNFNLINWSNVPYYLKIGVDITGGSSVVDLGTTQLFSVPYSLFSNVTRTVDDLTLSRFNDADTTGTATGKLLKWNGTYWMPAIDNHSDTVVFAYTSNYSIYSDTATNVYSSVAPDSVLFAYQTDSSLYSSSAENVVNTNSSVYSDTATYAFSIASWKRTGNTIGVSSYALGTTDAVSLVIKTNSQKRVELMSNGNLSIGNPFNTGSLSLLGNDGIFEIGTFGSGVASNPGAGSRMAWIPAKGAFRAGTIDTTSWGDSLGIYSFATGYNNRVGIYSFVSGNNCVAGDYNIAMGRKCQANARGAYPNGSGVALGDSCLATAQRTVAIGRGNMSSLSTAFTLGQYNKASGAVSFAIGSFCSAAGNYSSVMGYYGSSGTRVGGFLYADASSSAVTTATVHFQFLVRASGGTVFYTDSLNTMGVTLFAGSGSWASVSDRNKKENFESVNLEDVLTKIESLKIKSWNYKSESNHLRHIGPMAQDFYKLFGVGESNLTIATIDMDGIILSGIKALDDRINYLQRLKEIDGLTKRLVDLNDTDALNKRLDMIEAALSDKK